MLGTRSSLASSASRAPTGNVFVVATACCKDFMVSLRWPDGKVACPQCGSEKVTYLAKAKVWKCYAKHPRPTFTLKTGTIFEDSPISLEKWLPCAWLVINCKNGVSSYEISRDLGVTQKTAWFILHRIRLQAAWAVTRQKNCYLSAQFKRLAARRGVKRAVMAVAHTMLIIGYHMLKTGRSYHELGGDYLERINKDQLQRYYVKRLQRLGLKVTVEPVIVAA